MANITQVNLTAGVPTGPAGAATVSTIDNLIGAAGTASANVLSVQGVASGTTMHVTVDNANANGRASIANSAPVVNPASSVGTQSIVAGSATDVTILASNANRMGASVFNDGAAVLYLLLSNATSSTTVYTVQLNPFTYYEVPFNYTGVLKGIWASATGNARVTEYTT